MTKSGKHCGKRRNCTFCAISSFVTMFSKSRLLQRRQKASTWGKGLSALITAKSYYSHIFGADITCNYTKTRKQYRLFLSFQFLEVIGWLWCTYACPVSLMGSLMCSQNNFGDIHPWSRTRFCPWCCSICRFPHIHLYCCCNCSRSVSGWPDIYPVKGSYGILEKVFNICDLTLSHIQQICSRRLWKRTHFSFWNSL